MTWPSRRDVLAAAWMLGFAREAMAERTPWPPSLSFFVDEQDARALLERLNSDPEIAFIIRDGPRWYETLPPGSGWLIGPGDPNHRQRWRAVRDLERFEVDTIAGETVSAAHTLWFLPAGELPRRVDLAKEPEDTIPNPWAGWVDNVPSGNHPNFGYAFAGAIHLELHTETHTRLAVSTLEWNNNNHRVYAWSRLFEGWLGKVAVPLRVARYAPEIVWVFPSALRRLKKGFPYHARGMQLRHAIATAPDLPVPE
jgi:hypothetical protein